MKNRRTRKQLKVASSLLDEQTLGYFERVENVINDDDFEDEESRELFVENVFSQIENNEIKLFCDRTISRTMEKLSLYFSDIQVRKILQNIEEHYSKVAMDKCGSHVLQTLVCVIPKAIRSERSYQRKVSEEDKNVKGTEELFLSLCSRLQEDFSKLADHVNGSHVVRAVIEVLGGVKLSDQVIRSRASYFVKPTETVAIPESFSPILKHFTEMVITMDLQKLVLHPVSNPLLQTLLLVLHTKNQSLCKKLCKAVMSQIDMFSSKVEESSAQKRPKNDAAEENQGNEEESNYRVPILFSNEISSYMIEKILLVVSPKLWQKIYDSYFESHLPQLGQHPVANFVVQYLMASITDKSQANQVIVELLPYIEDFLMLGHVGVVARMAETVAQFQIKQKKFLKALLNAFHCKEKTKRSSAVVLISSLTTHEVFFGLRPEEQNVLEEDNSNSEAVSNDTKLKSVNYHGVLILKALFDFQDTNKIVSSFLSLSLEDVMILANDPVGSYAVEAFLKSRSVTNEQKHMFIEKMKGTYSKLSCEKGGSRVVEACWRNAEVNYKKAITEELAQSEQQLKANFYGKFVLRNCGVEHFKRKDKSWHEQEQRTAKKMKLLEDILEERVDGAVTDKNSKPKAQTGFKQLAPQMAALGFTWSGKRAQNFKTVRSY
ncbi:PREDICTED: nucleolar protein 9-like [Acropora digitifera]|uniref:nucleolar protein 9-like n=1 Tax=Acropora digitifera TaxID=70779 RepID=UPI00077AFFE8|nr:PREDICTED: nucleolar protein 9-like [Acropora digitifera]